MTRLTDAEILDRHRQSLGEAHRACQNLAKFADPTIIGLKAPDYLNLKAALDALIGSSRQLGTLRGDARWIRYGHVYNQARIMVQGYFADKKWMTFGKMTALFELGHRRLDELDMKTGVIGPILPQRSSEWLIMPPVRTLSPQRTMH